ncbi:MAG: YMGG-like glycine zipper-containing protein [Gallionellaceae bacterium]|nr:YMGG-like glycine zipper-containing protein [Gallionellaceae bacterium]
MKTRFVVPTLLLAGFATFGNAAMASDEFAGVLIGTGSGAIIGHAIGGRDGAVVGGILGAMVGAAIADDDYGRPVAVRPDYRPAYGPPVVYEAPRVRYVSTPVIVHTWPAPYAWRHHEWRDHRDGRWDRGYRDDHHDHWNDGRRGW